MNQVWLLWANLGIYQGNCIQEEGWPETALHLAEKRRTILAQIDLFDRHTYIYLFLRGFGVNERYLCAKLSVVFSASKLANPAFRRKKVAFTLVKKYFPSIFFYPPDIK